MTICQYVIARACPQRREQAQKGELTPKEQENFAVLLEALDRYELAERKP